MVLISFCVQNEYHATDLFSVTSPTYPTGHPLILKAMEIFYALLFQRNNKMEGIWLGPYAVAKAMDQVYNITDELDRKNMLCRGVYLYEETSLPKSHSLMANRTDSKLCNVAFSGMDANGAVRGFSRMKQYGTLDRMCMLNY